MSDGWTREYVVEVKHAELIAGSPFSHPFREEIVRCRDCVHMYTVRSWLGMDVDECWLHADPETGALGKNRTEPDGFCAWGERE